MLTNVLTAAGSWNSEQQLLTYLVPSELEERLQPGQLVAVPYGERLVSGIVWELLADDEAPPLEEEVELRPVRTILDNEPVLLPHQRALAEWIAEYYITPLSQVATMMLTRGLLQRSQFVLKLAENEQEELQASLQDASLQTRALVGLLLADGQQDLQQFKKMLGPKRANVLLKEALASGIIERDSQMMAPQAKIRMQRIVRLLLQGEMLEEWRRGMMIRVEQSLMKVEREQRPVEEPVLSAQRVKKVETLNPWILPTALPVITEPQDREGLLAQRKLAAVDLLLNTSFLEQSNGGFWTPRKLCEASKLTQVQLQQLVAEGVVSIEEIEIRRDPLQGRTITPSSPLELTPEQQRALNDILQMTTIPEGEYIPPILLHGVTGSGKTEVYLQALAALIERGQRGIILVPEIALTTQAVQRVAGRFPGRVAIIHSALSLGERYDEWRRIRSGNVDVVIGPRAALFAPVPNLGMIIIDEEHEPAYKQSELKPTYHARDAAIMLGQILHIPVVLGSATPSIESFYRAQQKDYRLIELPGRIGAPLPPVEIVDLRDELHAGNTSIISRRLNDELEQVLAQRQQAILFLNRRGAASCVLCRDCGFVAICTDCDIPLTYHATERMLLCHYCGRKREVLRFCPTCNSSGIRYFGVGTEKVQETIQRNFPSARLLRWDKDTAKNRRAHEQLLDRFANREADIMIGTQMIAKGLDLPGVTLVGVISADIALNLPDFSTSERMFTLLTQVAGRAGRGKEAGRVIIQTFNPHHLCIQTASHHDYHHFYETEVKVRQSYNYPPFCQFVKFTYSHEMRHRCQNEALVLCERITEWIERLGLVETDIVGPAPALMERIRGKYRWQMIVRGPDLHRLLRVIDAPGWDIDIDPVSIM